MLRWGMLGFVVGAAAVHTLATLPRLPPSGLAGSLVLALLGVAGVAWRHGSRGLPAARPVRPSAQALAPTGHRPWVRVRPSVKGRPGARRWRTRLGSAACVTAYLVGACGVGVTTTIWRAQARLDDALDPRHENLVTRLVVDVTGLPTGDAQGVRFAARVVSAPVPGVPGQILVGWYAAPHAGPGQAARAPGPDVRPGQRYSMALVLRRPHGALNPHGFDAQAWMFERGLRASATVRGAPRLLEDAPWRDAGIALQRGRHALREALRGALGEARWAPVVLALAMGDQAGVDAADWETFSRTGITHLVSISGLHVTLLAAMAAALVLRIVPRVRWRGVSLVERVPAQVPAAAVAVLIALAYSLIAGWGVPARRTFVMLAVVAAAVAARLPMRPGWVLATAVFVVTLVDPWAPLAAGFWLSFGAVAILMLGGTGRWRQRHARRWRNAVQAAVRAQALMSVALVPALAVQFQSVSLTGPLANALAIPVISGLTTPLALAALLLAPVGTPGVWLAAAAESTLAWLMVPVGWLADQAWAVWPVAAPAWPWVALAGLGVGYALLPPGLPGRHAAWLLILPVFLQAPARPLPGAWRLTALDVGQGSAVVIETTRHTVVFDTGPSLGKDADAGERVVWPYLRARGVHAIDELIVSHGDADHAGGMASVLERLPARRVRTSWAGDWPAPWSPCLAGQGWWLDGVALRFLHPATTSGPGAASAQRNANSCVLHVQGWHHAALLPGDIGQAEEAALAPASVHAEVVLMAHHGSQGSSAPAFVAATQARHAIAQAGFLSRFAHPRPVVLARWTDAGAEVHRTDHHGAIVVTSSERGLQVERQREVAARYWHRRD